MILNKYISKEITNVFIVVLSILLVVSLSNKFILYLSKAAMGLLPATWVCEVILLLVPELLAQVIPLALFFGILLSLSRMYADSEYTAMVTSGYKISSIIRVIFTLSVVVAIVVSILTLVLVPSVIEKRENILSKGEAAAAWQAIIPGRFQVLDEGKQVFYVEDVVNADTYKKIFIAVLPKQTKEKQNWTVITADKGELFDDNNDAYILLRNGHRYSGTPGLLDFSVMNFMEYGRKIISSVVEVPDYTRLQSTKKLLKIAGNSEIVELQWRLSLPISVLVLSLFAIGFAKVSVRHGRFAKILPGIILYIVYFNAMTIMRRSMMAEEFSSWGLVLVHLSFMTLGIITVANSFGKFNSIKALMRN